ncbi:MAG: DUF5683 domain-containing protein [bacterium]
MYKRVALAGLLLALLVPPLSAQSQSEVHVNVRSNPSGCTVVLSGDHTVSGVTPTTFSQPLRGYYRISAYRDGFDTYHSSIVLTGKDVTTIDINLVPKTRLKAGLRSLLIPGWGQRYSGSGTRGTLMTIGAVAAAAVAGLLYLDFDDKRDTYYDVMERFNDTREVSGREAMLNELYKAQKDAYDAERTKNLGVGILVGFWAFNVVDAMVFFPENGMEVAGVGIGFEPQIEADRVQLVGVFSF